MREKIEALIKSYEAHISRIKESMAATANWGLFEISTSYQKDIDIYESIIADLNEILG